MTSSPTATQTLAFAVPILAGKTDVDRAAMESCRSGERQADHAASRARAGITRESVWIQSTPGGDVAVVVLEGHDIGRKGAPPCARTTASYPALSLWSCPGGR